MNLEEADMAPELELNEIIWKSVHGATARHAAAGADRVREGDRGDGGREVGERGPPGAPRAVSRTASAARRLAPGPPSFSLTERMPRSARFLASPSSSRRSASVATAAGVNPSWINSGATRSPATRLTIANVSVWTKRRPMA